MPIAIAQIKDELYPGLMEVQGQYDMVEKTWDKVFSIRKSRMAVERATQMRFMPVARIKTEGSPTEFDNNAGQRYAYNVEHTEVSLGYAITRRVIDDNLYADSFNPTNLGLNNSFAQFKEIQAANVLNNCQTAIAGLGGDGHALASTAHPIDGATVANTFTVQLDLNEASLLQAQKNIRGTFRDEAGLLIRARAQSLVVPYTLEDVANRLVKAELRPGTSNNDPNVIPMVAGGLPKGVVVWDFLTSPYAWFVKTNVDGLLHFDRVPYEMDMWVDNTTDNLLVKGYERYSFAYIDWRAVYASLPTS